MTGRKVPSGWADLELPDSQALRDIIEDYLDMIPERVDVTLHEVRDEDDGPIKGRVLTAVELDEGVDALRSVIGLYRVQRKMIDSQLTIGKRVKLLTAALDAIAASPDMADLDTAPYDYLLTELRDGRGQIIKTTARDNLLRAFAQIMGFNKNTTMGAADCCNKLLESVGEKPISHATLRPIIIKKS